jgi:hypothetical protein
MIPLEDMLNIICTEAFEHSGVPEVPDHKHGERHNYSSTHRDAREDNREPRRSAPQQMPPLQFDLELIQDEDGKLHWVD